MRPRLLLATASAAVAASTAFAQQAIPLSIETIGNAQRLVIYAGINGDVPHPYLFDTGSSGFNAAFYDGPYSGPGSNPTAWSSTSTLSTNATASYGTPAQGFSYVLNAVTVPSIQIYSKLNLATPAMTLTATDTNPGSTGFIIGQVTNQTFNNGDPSSFQANLAAGLPPLSSGLYGTFGASLFTGNVTNGSAPYVNASVLGQSTTTGWAVVANTGTSSAQAILGLNSAIRSQFASQVAWTATGAVPFPNSNAIGSTEFGGGKFDFELSGGGNSPVNWTSDTLLDAGTQNNNLNFTGDQIHLDPYESSSPQVDANYTISATGITPGSGTYSFVTTTGVSPVTYEANVGSNKTHSTVGIGFFLNNSVAFDLENQQTLYTSNVVAVPEPATAALAGWALAGTAALALLRRRQRR